MCCKDFCGKGLGCKSTCCDLAAIRVARGFGLQVWLHGAFGFKGYLWQGAGLQGHVLQGLVLQRASVKGACASKWLHIWLLRFLVLAPFVVAFFCSAPLGLRFFFFAPLVAAFFFSRLRGCVFFRAFEAALLGSGPLLCASAAEDSRENFVVLFAERA